MTGFSSFRGTLVGGSSALAFVLSVPAIAADAAADAAADTNSGQLETIIVTAQKRSENLQQVPISVSTITPQTIETSGALRTDDLAVAVPGLTIQHEINSVTTFIRGIGPQSNGVGEESSVAVYLDDLYIEQGNGGIFDLNSVSDVQVLKGPQGTLFGRNATGGVIQVKTKDPEFDPSIDGHIGYGNYETKSGDLYVTGPIIPGLLAGNLSIYGADESAGWGRDIITGQRAFTSEDHGGRIKFLLTPFDGTKIKLSYAHLVGRSEVGLGAEQVPGSVSPGGGTFVGFYNNEDVGQNDVSVTKHDLVELRIDQDTPYAKIVSISGWQRLNAYALFDQDASPAQLVEADLKQVGRDFSQEVQILNPDDASYASWFTWIFGGYYLHDKSGYNHATLTGLAFQPLPPSGYLDLTDQVTTTSGAGFAQGTVEFLPNSHFTVGARYTRDERVFGGGVTLEVPAFSLAVPVTNFTGTPGTKKTYNLQTYRVSLDHQFTSDLLAYFAFNRGEKSGEYDTFGTAEAGPVNNPPVNPELLYSYEVGVKSEWFDHHLRINAAAFHYDVSNLQFSVIVAGGTKLINAAGAEIDGFELDYRAKPISNLTVSGAFSAQYGRYTSFPNAPDVFNPPTFTFNAAGKETIRTPHFTAQIGVDYTIPQPFGDFDLNVNFTHTGTYQYVPDGSDPSPETDILNASVLWVAPSGEYDIRLWGSNILNQKYYSFGYQNLGLGTLFSPAAPATFGATLGFHFADFSSPAPAEATPLPPAPPPPAPAAPAPEAKRLFQVFFDFDRATITEAAAKVIQSAADVVKAGTPVQIVVTGHTDTVGSAAYNQGLSERRAAAVKQGLVSDGVPASEITATGVGKTGLLVPTADGVREAQNRRAEIVLQ